MKHQCCCAPRRMKGYQLIFISWILRDGSGTEKIKKGQRDYLNKDEYTINALSISQRTYIASGFNSYVVRIKKRYQ